MVSLLHMNSMYTFYIAQGNEVVERKNVIVLNTARSILKYKNLPKMFWEESVQWAFHVLNRWPTTEISNKTPHEAWFGKKPFIILVFFVVLLTCIFQMLEGLNWMAEAFCAS